MKYFKKFVCRINKDLNRYPYMNSSYSHKMLGNNDIKGIHIAIYSYIIEILQHKMSLNDKINS